MVRPTAAGPNWENVTPSPPLKRGESWSVCSLQGVKMMLTFAFEVHHLRAAGRRCDRRKLTSAHLHPFLAFITNISSQERGDRQYSLV